MRLSHRSVAALVSGGGPAAVRVTSAKVTSRQDIDNRNRSFFFFHITFEISLVKKLIEAGV